MSDKVGRGQLIENDMLVQVLRRAVKDGGNGLSEVPGFLKKVLREGRWKSRVIEQSGRPAEFDSFEEFVTTPPLLGMGTTVDMLRRICADDPEAIDLLDRALQHKHGGNRKPKEPKAKLYNVQLELAKPPTGNSRAAALRRLRTARPDLHSKVLEGTMTASAAMVIAGFRPKSVSIPLQPEQAAKALFNAAVKNGIPWSNFQDAINLVSIKPASKSTPQKSTNLRNAQSKKRARKPANAPKTRRQTRTNRP